MIKGILAGLQYKSNSWKNRNKLLTFSYTLTKLTYNILNKIIFKWFGERFGRLWRSEPILAALQYKANSWQNRSKLPTFIPQINMPKCFLLIHNHLKWFGAWFGWLWGSEPILAVLQYKANSWQNRSKLPTFRPLSKISLISKREHVPRIRY